MEVRGQFARIGSSLPLCGSEGSNSEVIGLGGKYLKKLSILLAYCKFFLTKSTITNMKIYFKA